MRDDSRSRIALAAAVRRSGKKWLQVAPWLATKAHDLDSNNCEGSMSHDLFNLDQEIAVVLGGTGTLGGAIAGGLAAAGARVAVLGRNEEHGQERIQSIQADGGEALFHRADVLNPDSLREARDHVVNRWGGVSVLVNAAGGNRPSATLSASNEFCRLPLEAWHEVFDLNLVGSVLLPCQVFGETLLAAGRGSIVNIASMAGMTPLTRVVAYSAAKAAVINLTKFLAREWATRGIRVNSLSPGFFPSTANHALLFNEDGSYSERSKEIIAHTPMARLGDPGELVGAVVWLASARASSFVTGQNIVVDGGFSSTTI
jgi:NAD(P)-dependent dehydrogenase (short-subunit alcohol dehydrogenase family)